MNYSKWQLWQRFQKYYTEFPQLGLAIDISRMSFPDDFLSSMEPSIQRAYAEMAELEHGAIANPDEKRMVGHYWLRNPALAPTRGIREEIEPTVAGIKSFAAQVHEGSIKGSAGPFKHLLLIGIGGSALGPQFVANALGQSKTEKLATHFLDNTDRDVIDKTLSQLDGLLGQTITVVVSKSGGTKDTRNGMVEAEARYKAAGLTFGPHAVAITSEDSALDKLAVQQGWLARFPMWEQDRDGKLVNQGITALGNKGSMDQHSYIQQFRDGLNNFFVIFVEVLRDRVGSSLMVEPNTTSGDFLEGFLLGTKQALFGHNRYSITLTLDSMTGFRSGCSYYGFTK